MWPRWIPTALRWRRVPDLEAIEAFVASLTAEEPILIADGEPGVFDEHSRRLAKPLLADIFTGSHEAPVTAHAFGKGKKLRESTVRLF